MYVLPIVLIFSIRLYFGFCSNYGRREERGGVRRREEEGGVREWKREERNGKERGEMEDWDEKREK